MGAKLRVLVVDDSSICRIALKTQLEAEGDIEVVGEGEDAFSALELVQKLEPDLVTMDVQMPGKSGLEAVDQIMHRKPTPILVVTAESLSDEAGVAFRAIENGALDIVPKPSMTDDDAAAQLRTLVRQLATVPVFQRFEGARAPSTSPAAPGDALELVVIGAGAGGMGSRVAPPAQVALPRHPLPTDRSRAHRQLLEVPRVDVETSRRGRVASGASARRGGDRARPRSAHDVHEQIDPPGRAPATVARGAVPIGG